MLFAARHAPFTCLSTSRAAARRSPLASSARLLSSSTALSQREVDLLQQVARLEARCSALELFLPMREQPTPITKWEDLTFGITPTNGHVRHVWSSKTNSWDAGRLISDPFVNLHIHAGVLHYGMTLFEGCKAFRCADGKVRVCNLNENSARMNTGAKRLVMPSVPEQIFNNAVDWAVRANAEFVPPYGTGGSMYIRPFLMGSGPILGLQPCPEFHFMVSVTPVGNYFGQGGVQGVHASVSRNYDRAAPRGTGDVKAGGNYAADLLPLKIAKAEGFGTTLYLDAAEQKSVSRTSNPSTPGPSTPGCAYCTSWRRNPPITTSSCPDLVMPQVRRGVLSLQLHWNRPDWRLLHARVRFDPPIDHKQDAHAGQYPTSPAQPHPQPHLHSRLHFASH